MLHLISLSHPFFTKEGSVTLLLTIYRSSVISLRPITAQSDALHAGPKGACLHESHWAKLLTLQRLLHSSACQARQWAQRGGGIPRGISWNAIRPGWGRRHLLVWEKRLWWQVDGKAARLACVVSWGWVGQPHEKMVWQGALALCSQYPVTTTQTREEWSPGPCLVFKIKKKSKSSWGIETAWSNQSAFWSKYECLEEEKRHMCYF